MRTHSTARLALLAGLASASQALAQASFTPLGHLPGGDYSLAVQVSPDGSAIGGLASDATGTVGFRWTAAAGIVAVGDLAGGTVDTGTGAASGYGIILAGSGYSANGLEACRWTEEIGLVPMGDLPGGAFSSHVYCLSHDGSVFYGIADDGRQRAARWTRIAGWQALPSLPGELFSDAFGCSGDGSVVTGLSGTDDLTQAYRWTEATGMVGLGDLAGGESNSGGADVSDDGSTIVGYASTDAGYVAMVWTEATGMINAGLLAGDDTAELWAVNADGTVAVGYSGERATIWTVEKGLRSLQDVLINEHGLGAELSGWTLASANSVSSDGRVIVGYGHNPAGEIEAWRVELPEPCPADFNEDGTVNTIDVLKFLNAWNAGCP